MIRNFIITLVVLVSSQLVFSEPNIYAGASENTRLLLAKVDNFISKQAYESAFKALGTSNDDEFIVAKKTEICINYFAQSLNHVMFAFKDLTPGETLNKLRSDTGSYTMYSFNPVELITKLQNSGKKNPILYKILGDYYYDVSQRYRGRWTESDEAIAQKVIKNYSIAHTAGILDSYSLSNYADKTSELGDFSKAFELYKLALGLNPDLPDANFNIAYASLRLGKFKDALRYGEEAISKYKTNPNYRMDAILLCVDAAYYSKDYTLALQYLNRGLEISRQDYRVFQKQAYVNFAKGDLEAAEASLDELFSLSPDNPSATQMVTEALDAFGKQSRIQSFFIRNIPKYSKNPEAQANLYFHQALDLENAGNKAEALKIALLAKNKFIEAGIYSDQIKQAIEALVSRNT